MLLPSTITSQQPGAPRAPVAERPGSNELAVIAKAVLEDHTELDRTLTKLRELCMALRDDLAPEDPGPAEVIAEFECQVIPHFVAEEVEEFFGSLATDAPHLLSRVARLQAEHWEIAEALDALLEFAESGPPGPDLAIRLSRFIDGFDVHEHAENALMQDILLLDEGGSGA